MGIRHIPRSKPNIQKYSHENSSITSRKIDFDADIDLFKDNLQILKIAGSTLPPETKMENYVKTCRELFGSYGVYIKNKEDIYYYNNTLRCDCCCWLNGAIKVFLFIIQANSELDKSDQSLLCEIALLVDPHRSIFNPSREFEMMEYCRDLTREKYETDYFDSALLPFFNWNQDEDNKKFPDIILLLFFLVKMFLFVPGVLCDYDFSTAINIIRKGKRRYFDDFADDVFREVYRIVENAVEPIKLPPEDSAPKWLKFLEEIKEGSLSCQNIMQRMNISRAAVMNELIHPALDNGYVDMTEDESNNPNQRYQITSAGKLLLAQQKVQKNMRLKS